MTTIKKQPEYLNQPDNQPNWSAFDDFTAPPAAEKVEQHAGIARTAGDMAIKGAQGIVDLGSAVVGLGSLATGGLVGKGMREIGYDPKRTNEALGEYLSDDQKASDAAVQGEDSFLGAAGASLTHPRALAGSIVQSLPGMIAGMGAAGAAARAIGVKAAAAFGGMETEAGARAAAAAIEKAGGKLMAIGSATEGAQSAGQIADDAQAAGRTYGEYAPAAVAAGLGTAAIGFGAGKLVGDAATDIATGSRTLVGSKAAKVGKEMFSEGVLEEMPQSAQEQYFTNIAQGEQDRSKGVANAAGAGMITGGVMGGGMGLIHGDHAPTPTPVPLADTGPLSRAANAAQTALAEQAAASSARAAAAAAAAAQSAAPAPALPLADIDARMAELISIGHGSPARRGVDGDGNPVVIPAVHGRPMSPDEKGEYEQLKAARAARVAIPPDQEAEYNKLLAQEQAERDQKFQPAKQAAAAHRDATAAAEAQAQAQAEHDQIAAMVDADEQRKAQEDQLRQEQDLKDIANRVERENFERGQANRTGLRDDVIADPSIPDEQKKYAYRAALKQAGYSSTKLNEEDHQAIDAATAPLPTLPNELTDAVPERRPAEPVAGKPNTKAVDDAIAAGMRLRTPSGNVLHKPGSAKVFKLSTAQKEHYLKVTAPAAAPIAAAVPEKARDFPVSGENAPVLAPNATENGKITAAAAADPDGDDLYQSAVDIVRKTQRPSISVVQRHLRVGYNRAARLLEQMQQKGLVSEMRSDGSRDLIAAAPNDVSSTAEQQGLIDAPSTQSDAAANTLLDSAAHEAATSPLNDLPEPTQAQKEAGNYKVGRVNLHGLDLSIENPTGSTRSGVDKDGKPWQTTMQHHYGYIRGTVGADKDHIDTFVGTNHDSDKVFVVDQVDPATGKFDEHKVMLGFDSAEQARAAYQANYAPDWTGGRHVSETTVDGFKSWLASGKTKKPFSKAKKPAPPASLSASIADALAKLAELRSQKDEAEKIGNGWAYDGLIKKAQAELDDYIRAQKAAHPKFKEDHATREGADLAMTGKYLRFQDGNFFAPIEVRPDGSGPFVVGHRIDPKGKPRRGNDGLGHIRFFVRDGRLYSEYGSLISDPDVPAILPGEVKILNHWPLDVAEPALKLPARMNDGQQPGESAAPADMDAPATAAAPAAPAPTKQDLNKMTVKDMTNEQLMQARIVFADHPARGPKVEKEIEKRGLLTPAATPSTVETPATEGAKPTESALIANGTAPEHVQIGVDDRELGQIVDEFNGYQADMMEGEHAISNIFQPPAKGEVVRLNDKAKVYHKEHGWMTPAEARVKIEQWKAHAQNQGADAAIRSANSQRVVLSLFDLSGEWSRPWEEAGYQVYRFDIQADPEVGDVNNFSTEFFGDWFGDFEGLDIYAILAATPCTDFAVSGARHFAAKDADGRTIASVKLVHQTMATIEHFKPAVWALENPVGRIERLGGLPAWRLSFDPNHLGDPYTKKTLIWGRFNGDLPVAPVEPTEGSKMHKLYGGKSMATKNARSVTPEGFSYGFFMANNAHDHAAMAIANKFDRLDRSAIEEAVAAGVTESEITSAVEDHYYMDHDDEAANAAVRELTAEKSPAAPDPAPAPTKPKQSAKRKAKETAAPAAAPAPVAATATAAAPDFGQRAGAVLASLDSIKSWDDVSTAENELFDLADKMERAKAPLAPLVRMAADGVRVVKLVNEGSDTYAKEAKGIRGTLKDVVKAYPAAAAPAAPAEKAAQAAPAAAPATLFDNNKLFTNAAVEAARKRMKSKLGQINSGIDPELMMDGITIAGAYIEAGVRAFSAFSKAMIEDLGEGVRPYLRSFYEGTRHYPGLDTAGMSTAAEIEAMEKAGEAPHLQPLTVENEAIGETVKVAAKPKKATDTVLRDDWGVEHIDGWTEIEGGANEQTDFGLRGGLKDAFLKDAQTYLRKVSAALQEQGFVAYKDAKNKVRKIVTVNEAGPAVSGEVSLSMVQPEKGRGIYMQISGSAMRGMFPTTKSGVDLMMRVSTASDPYKSIGGNRWMPVNLAAVDLAEQAGKAVHESALRDPKLANGSTITDTETQTAQAVTKEQDNDSTPPGGAPAVDQPLAEGQRPASGQPDAGSAATAGARDGRGNDRSVRAARGRDQVADDARPDLGNQRGNSAISDRSPDPVGRGDERVSADFRPDAGGLTREGSWLDSAKRNIDLIELARNIEREGRPATTAEQAQLSKYVGFGASAIRNKLFPIPPAYLKQQQPDRLIWPNLVQEPSWRELAQRMDALPAAWQRSVLQSSQYAHYTSEGIIRSTWGAMQRLGFTGGKVFEPGMGIGSFSMLMPDQVRATSRYTGVEFDGPTALIARLLSPEQNMLHDDFIKRKFPKDFFDVAIGNPPFSQTKIFADPDYEKHGFMLHDFFFAKSIDRVRPGGLLAFVTSKGTMDKQADKARNYLAARADLVGAIRLPSTAFESNAGTSVVTDVIFLRKRLEGEAPAGQAWAGVSTVDTKDGPVVINEYFAAHPDMVLGQNRISGNTDDMGRRINSNGRGGEAYTVVSYDSTPAELDAKFAAAVERLPANVYSVLNQSSEGVKRETAKVDFDPSVKREGVVYIGKDGAIMRVENGVGQPLEAGMKMTEADKAWFAGYVGMRDLVQETRLAQATDGKWEASLKKLNKAYDAFRAEHGPINDFRVQVRKSTDEDGKVLETESRIFKNRRRFREDYDSAILTQLETINEAGEIVKSPFLLGRTIGKPTTRDVKTIGDALAVSLDDTGRLDLADVGNRIGLTREETIEALGNQVYLAPSGEWQLADEYLSGDVVSKLEEAEQAARIDPRLLRNVEALKEAQPEKLGPSQISAKLGASWIPAAHVNEFAKEIDAGAVTFDSKTETWQVDGGNLRSQRRAGAEYGTAARSPAELLEAALNSRSVKVTNKIEGKTVVDQEATTAANEALKKIKDKFKGWVWTDSDRATELVEAYNRRFNNIAPRRFDGSHLTLPGVSMRYTLHPHQKNGIARIIQTGDTYLNHAVGSGKTIEMIAAGMEQKRLGLIKKPMYVVPNHMLEQFANEFMELYPLANIMVADDENFSAERRKAFIASATLNNPDAVIITHDAFQRIGVKEESVAPIRDEILADLEMELSETANNNETRVRRSQLEQQIEAVTQRFDRIIGAGGKDSTLKFEDIGVDFVFADEAHVFRKLDFHTAQQIKGIDPNGSKRALDMYVKTRWLQEQRPGRAMVFASGTPVTNTMGELYTIMRFFAPAELDRAGISTFDAWARQFGEVSPALEPNAAGKYELIERFAKFDNVPELMSRVRQFMDVLTSEHLGALVKRPDLIGGKPNLNIVPPSPDLERYMKTVLGPRIEKSKRWKPSKDEPNNPDPIVSIITDGRFAAIDPRFFGGTLGEEGSIITAMGDKVVASYHAGKDNVYQDKNGKDEPIKGSTQLVFYNMGFGEQSQKNRGFNSRAAFTKRLTDGGIPRDQIAWFDDANTDAKKEAVFKDMRSGKLRVLIGSAKKMGTGVNVQKRLAVLHYQDPPWFPADVEQPHGRIIRQGNQNSDVAIEWYTTKGTYQSTMWQMVGRKQRFIDQAFSGDKTLRSMDDMGEASLFEQAAAVASGDPRAIQLAGLKQEVERFERLQAAHASEQISVRSALRGAEWQVESAARNISNFGAAFKAIGERMYTFTTAKVGDATFDKVGEFGQAVKDAFNQVAADGIMGNRVRDVAIGALGDNLKLTVDAETVNGKEKGEYTLYVTVGDLPLAVATTSGMGETVDAVGLGRRIINQVNSISGDLTNAKARLASGQTDLIRLRKKNGAPFEYQQEMAEKYGELKRLEEELRAEGAAAPALPVVITEDGATAEEAAAAGKDDPAEAEYYRGDIADFLPAVPASVEDGVPAPTELTGAELLAAKRSTEQLNRQLVKAGLAPVRALRAAPNASFALARQIGEALGIEVNFVSKNPDFEGVAYKGIAYIAEGMRNSELAIAGHETLHALEQGNPALAAQLRTQIRTYLKDGAVEDRQAREYAANGLRDVTMEQAESEVIADINGSMWIDPVFWSDLAKADRSLFRAVAYRFMQVAAKAIQALRGSRFDAGALVKDVAAVRAIMVSTWAQHNAGRETAPAMFEQEEKPRYNDPYATIQTRPGTTDAQRDAGRAALSDLSRRFGIDRIGRGSSGDGGSTGTLLGSRLYDNFVAGKSNQLVGQVARTPQELAMLAQVYRDPRFETFRIFFTKGNTIVGETGYTSRLPAIVGLSAGWEERAMNDMVRYGADGYYIVHNHPSGDPTPSDKDVETTQKFARVLGGFRGHVIIDHNRYVVMHGTGAHKEYATAALNGVDFKSRPELEHRLLGVTVGSMEDVAVIAKSLQIPDGHATMLMMDASAEVQLIVDVPMGALGDFSKLGIAKAKALVRRMARESGSGGGRVIVLPSGVNAARFRRWVELGVFHEVISADGSAASRTVKQGDDYLRSFKNRIFTLAEPRTSAFKRWFGNSQVLTPGGRPKVVYHGTDTEFTVFDRSHTGRTTLNDGIFGNGFYTTSEKWRAAEYGDNVGSYYVSIQKPFVMQGDDSQQSFAALASLKGWSAAQLAEIAKLKEVLDQWHIPEDMLAQIYEPALWADGSRGDYGVRFTALLRENGFDGVIVHNADPEGTTEYLAFDNTQIKIAKGNNGDFDPDNSDVRFSRTPAEGNAFTSAAERRFTQAIAEAEHWMHSNGKTAHLGGMSPTEAYHELDFFMGHAPGLSETAKVHGRAIWDRVQAAYSQLSRVTEVAAGNPNSTTKLKQPDAIKEWTKVNRSAWNTAFRRLQRLAADGSVSAADVARIQEAAASEMWGPGNLATLSYEVSARARRAKEKARVTSPAASMGDSDLQFSRPEQQGAPRSPAFTHWFGNSKVVDAAGNPMVMYHGTPADIDKFTGNRAYFTADPAYASGYAEKPNGNVMPVYLSLQRPLDMTDLTTGDHSEQTVLNVLAAKGVDVRGLRGLVKGKGGGEIGIWAWWHNPAVLKAVKASGFDSIIQLEETRAGKTKAFIALDPNQIKSAIGNNGAYDPEDSDIRFSRANLGDALASAAGSIADVRLPADYRVGDLFNASGKVSWWHKTIGTMDNLAKRAPAFNTVYQAVQSFLGDVSRYAVVAADLAPTLLPKLENISDVIGKNRKKPLTAEDTRAIAGPIFEGTLTWARDAHGKPVKIAELEEQAAQLTTSEKAQILLQKGVIDDEQNQAWLRNPLDFYDKIINGKFESTQLKAGIVWSDAELRTLFNQTDTQIGLYREFRSAIDKSLTNLTISEMVKLGGKDAKGMIEQAVAAPDLIAASNLLRDHFMALAQMHPEKTDMHLDTAQQILNLADKGQDLMDRGYAPLSRFGKYTVYVQKDGEQLYFGMFETQYEASKMARDMQAEHPDAQVNHGTISEDAYKLFAGVSPETIELFGSMVGLDSQADAQSTEVYQTYLKLAKNNRSSMKRLIHRKGIAGFSEDAGRVLAGFVYSNARLTAGNAHLGEIDEAIVEIPKQQGELTDAAMQLREHIRNPEGGGSMLGGMMFAQFLGGSVASAMVNLTQPLTMTLPFLSQWGGLGKASKRLTKAVGDVIKGDTGDAALEAALKWASDEGIVAPQEVHFLQAQAQGKGALRAGDGTKAGNTRAHLNNTMSKVSLGWGKLFAMAELTNRRVTFIAAYRTAVEEGMPNPERFAQEAVSQTQGTYNSGNKPKWARGAIGGLLMTFKQYSIGYLELLSRMAFAGEPGSKERAAGRRAALYMVAVLFLMGGADGLPFEQDLEDALDGILQRLGYNFSSKRSKQAFLTDVLGQGGADFALKGISAMPGMPIDVAGRFGMGNLLPGTGLLTKKASYTSDLGELVGPAGDLAKRAFTASGKALGGDLLGAALDLSPASVRNVAKGVDMLDTGTYRDGRGYIVNKTSPSEAVMKMIGFQPNSTADVQDQKGQALNMIGQNRMRSVEIAEHWAQGLANGNPDMVQEARDMRADWNAKNPEAPIKIDLPAIIRRVRAMKQDAIARTQKTAPAALKQTVRAELAHTRE